MTDSIKEETGSYGEKAISNTSIKQERVKAKQQIHRSETTSVNYNVTLEIALTEENESKLLS